MKVKEVKEIGKRFGYTHLVVIGVNSDGMSFIATHGDSTSDAARAAKIGNQIKAMLGWPPDLCQSKPTERICGNCDFCSSSVSGSGAHWYECCVEIKAVSVKMDRIACKYFKSKY